MTSRWRDLRDDDAMTTALAERRAQPGSDPVVALLGSWAAAIDERPMPAVAPAPVVEVARRSRRARPRRWRVAAAVTVALMVSSSGIAAATTGNPLDAIGYVAAKIYLFGHPSEKPHRDYLLDPDRSTTAPVGTQVESTHQLSPRQPVSRDNARTRLAPSRDPIKASRVHRDHQVSPAQRVHPRSTVVPGTSASATPTAPTAPPAPAPVAAADPPLPQVIVAPPSTDPTLPAASLPTPTPPTVTSSPTTPTG